MIHEWRLCVSRSVTMLTFVQIGHCERERRIDLIKVCCCFYRAWRELNSECWGVGSCWTPGQWHISPGSFLLQQQCTIGGDFQTCAGNKLYWNHCEWRGWEGMGGERNRGREVRKHSGVERRRIFRGTEKLVYLPQWCNFCWALKASCLLWMSCSDMAWSLRLCRVRCHLDPMEYEN